MLPKSIFIVVACAAKLVAAAVITIHDFSYVSVGLEEGASSLANDDGSSGIVDSLIYEDPDSSADADAATQPIETMAIANPKDIPKFGVLCASAPQAYTSKDIADAIATFTTAPKHWCYPKHFMNLNKLIADTTCSSSKFMEEFPIFHGPQFTGGGPGADRVIVLRQGQDVRYCGVAHHVKNNNFSACRAKVKAATFFAEEHEQL